MTLRTRIAVVAITGLLGAVPDGIGSAEPAGKREDAQAQAVARRANEARIKALEQRYAGQLALAGAESTKLREAAIARLEKFLREHPDRDELTPDAMFRLADLYVDQVDQDIETRLERLEAASPSAIVDESLFIADYERSLELWEGILARFPTYRQTASTLYLLAYRSRTKDERRSLQLFLSLACANKFKWNDPPSKPPSLTEVVARAVRATLRDPYADCTPYPNADPELVRHAWVRGIASYHFTVPGELDESIAGYRKGMVGDAASPLYPESLYRLAWSYYERGSRLEALRLFDESVTLYDTTVAAGKQPPLELRDEAISDIADLLTDPWDGKPATDPVKAMAATRAFYQGREREPHVHDVWVAIGHAFAELHAWVQAVEAYRAALGPPWQLHADSPMVDQGVLVNVLEAKGDKAAADAAVTELATKYTIGTSWHAANERNAKALATERTIAERAMYAAACNTHASAKRLRADFEASAKKDPADRRHYLAIYAKAVELYRRFIATYPGSDHLYELTYFEGEALYFSERYLEAVDQYKWVRDQPLSKLRLDAARSVVSAYEAEVQRQVSSGMIPALEVPTTAALEALPKPLTPQPIPALYLRLQAEYDNLPTIEKAATYAPQQALNAALISVAYLHFDDSIARFQKVIDKFCATPIAAKAKDGIIAIYAAQGQLALIEKTVREFAAAKCGGP